MNDVTGMEDSAGMAIGVQVNVYCGKRGGDVYRLLGPVLLEWVEANEPEKDPENWSSKCVLRWKKKIKQPHPRTKQQRTEKPRKNAVCRTSVRPCALLLPTQEYTLVQL